MLESKLPEIRKILEKIESKINENDLDKSEARLMINLHLLKSSINEIAENFREMSQVTFRFLIFWLNI